MTYTKADSEIRTKASLCTGTGALDMATPGELQWYAETNPSAQQILKREHPDAINIGDITDPWDVDLDHSVDLLTSGDPCQSMSAAGRQMASQDERFLWPDVMRVIRATRPGELFLENVQNLTSVALLKGADDWRGQKGSVLKLRLDNLREAGYAARWTVLGACAVGAPHHRHRWFLRATYVGANAPEAQHIVSRCGAPRGGGRVLLPTTRARDWKGGTVTERPIDGGPDLPSAIALLPTPTKSDGGGGAGKSANGHDGYNLRTAATLLPTPAARDGGDRGTPTREHALRRIANPERTVNLEEAVIAHLLPTPWATDGPNGGPNQRNGRGEYDALPDLVVNLLPTPTTRDVKGRKQRDDGTCLPGAVIPLLQTPTTRNGNGNKVNGDGMLLLPGQVQPEVWDKFASAVALWETILGRPAPEPTEAAPRGGRRLSAALPEWMMGYPAGYLTEGFGRSEALKMAGNGVVRLQAEAAWRLLA